MNLELVRERFRNGFRPFRVQLSDGRKFAVPHPESVIIGRNAVGILSRTGKVTTIDALHIATLEDLQPSRWK